MFIPRADACCTCTRNETAVPQHTCTPTFSEGWYPMLLLLHLSHLISTTCTPLCCPRHPACCTNNETTNSVQLQTPSKSGRCVRSVVSNALDASAHTRNHKLILLRTALLVVLLHQPPLTAFDKVMAAGSSSACCLPTCTYAPAWRSDWAQAARQGEHMHTAPVHTAQPWHNASSGTQQLHG
jgi:hypothetical protein